MDAVTEAERGDGVFASAVAGDQAAFERIVATHHSDMVRVAFLVCRDTDLASEAAQVAWTIAWRKLSSVRAEESLRAWLLSVAANEARQLIRRSNRRSVREIHIDSETGAELAGSAAHDESVDLLNALGRLSPEDRSIVAMHYAFGLSSEEIGKAVGLSAPGVRSRLARAIARLRKDLGDE
jgi:RNA polymerase sigma-70 factor, ECF subfamily